MCIISLREEKALTKSASADLSAWHAEKFNLDPMFDMISKLKTPLRKCFLIDDRNENFLRDQSVQPGLLMQTHNEVYFVYK